VFLLVPRTTSCLDRTAVHRLSPSLPRQPRRSGPRGHRPPAICCLPHYRPYLCGYRSALSASPTASAPD